MTWDVDSADGAQCGNVRRFVFGYTIENGSRRYAYAGFLQRPGVRYLGQSVLFVPQGALKDLRAFLRKTGVDHHVIRAALEIRDGS